MESHIMQDHFEYHVWQWLVDRRWWYVRVELFGHLVTSYTAVMDDYGDLVEASPR